GEQRAGLEDKAAGPLVKNTGAEQVAGQQVGGELDAVEGTVEAAGQGLGQQRLADARDVLDEQVPLAEQGDEGHADDFRLAEEDAGDVVLQALQRRSGADSGYGGSDAVAQGGASRGGPLNRHGPPSVCRRWVWWLRCRHYKSSCL